MAELIPDDIDFSAYLKESDAKRKVKPASVFIDDSIEKLRNHANVKKVFLPWDKTHALIDFKMGEVSLWCGQNGHGKSLMTTQLALSLMGQNERACIASFEMKPTTTITRMARLYAGTNPYSPEYQDGIDELAKLYTEFSQWSDGKLWLYDQQGTAKAELVIGMARYCAKELGIRHVFIDSLMKCVAGEDDYNGQKLFVDEMCALAKDNDCHIHLVHHLRKPASEAAIPDKHDTKGSGSITDQVDNVFMVWRNKPKEEDFRLNGKMGKKQQEPDSYLLCRKQRNYEGSEDGEPSIGLWMHRDSSQFLGSPTDEPMLFGNWPHRATSF